MADWADRRTLEYRENEVGFAVRVVDAFTGDEPEVQPAVTLAGRGETPVTNPSGYHVFTNLSAERVELVVDGGELYFDESRTVVLDDEDADHEETVVLPDRSTPVRIELVPTPSFPFDDGTTLVAGHVETEDGEPVAGATVSVETFDARTTTTESGEYVLPLPVGSDDVVKTDGRTLVTAAGGGNGRAVANGGYATPTLEVSHPDHGSVTETVEIEAGSRTVRYVTLP